MEWILYVGIAQALFVASYVISKSPHVLTDYILAIWLVFLSFPMITKITYSHYPNLIIPYVFDIRSFPLTFGPFLLLYTRSLITTGFKLKSIELVHFIPFVLFAAIQIIAPELFVFPESKALAPPPLTSRIHGLSILISLVSYSIFVLILLRRHRKQVAEYFSSNTQRVTLNWLHWITVGFIIAYSTPFLIKITVVFLDLSPVLHGIKLHGQAFTFFIFVLGFFGLKQSPVYQGTDTTENKELSNSPPVLIKNNKKNPKYERSGLKEDNIPAYLERLEDYMQQSKPYLDANLNIEVLARSIKIPKHYITLILNKKLEKNFHQFINHYRIRDAINQLQKNEKSQTTILEIAYASGFNSKSTFNTLFKKQTQMTPSEFRKKYHKKEFDLGG